MNLRRTNAFHHMTLKTFCLGLTLVATMTGRPVFAQDAPDDATIKLGQRSFLLCMACHSTEQNGPTKIGPNLWGIFGRKAGTQPDFKYYSDALKNSGITWSDKTLDQWFARPNELVPGTKMAFRGIDNEDNRKALIAYLKLQTGAAK
jgi:cytochrome c